MICREHRSLASAIRMSAEEHATRCLLAHQLGGSLQPLLVHVGASTRRSMRPKLTKGKIDAKHCNSFLAELVCQCDQQRRHAVGSRPVRKHESIVNRSLWAMK